MIRWQRMRGLGWLFLLAGCSEMSMGTDASIVVPPRSCPIGDLTLAPEVELLHRAADGSVVRTPTSSTSMPLFQSDQGGYFLFVSMRARNLDGCKTTMVATVKDPCSGKTIGSNTRQPVLVPGADGWSEPESPEFPTNFVDVSVCPSIEADRQVYAEEYRLEVRLESEGKTAAASTTIIPFCSTVGQARCLCECHPAFLNTGSCQGSFDAGIAGSCDGGP